MKSYQFGSRSGIMKTPPLPYHILLSKFQSLFSGYGFVGLLQQKIPSKIITIINTFVVVVVVVVVVHPSQPKNKDV